MNSTARHLDRGNSKTGVRATVPRVRIPLPPLRPIGSQGVDVHPWGCWSGAAAGASLEGVNHDAPKGDPQRAHASPHPHRRADRFAGRAWLSPHRSRPPARSTRPPTTTPRRSSCTARRTPRAAVSVQCRPAPRSRCCARSRASRSATRSTARRRCGTRSAPGGTVGYVTDLYVLTNMNRIPGVPVCGAVPPRRPPRLRPRRPSPRRRLRSRPRPSHRRRPRCRRSAPRPSPRRPAAAQSQHESFGSAPEPSGATSAHESSGSALYSPCAQPYRGSTPLPRFPILPYSTPGVLVGRTCRRESRRRHSSGSAPPHVSAPARHARKVHHHRVFRRRHR